jgi:hypothetical protein
MPEVSLIYPVNTLVSFHYFRTIDIEEMKGWGLRMIGDSGAFSAMSTGTPISLSEFAEWAERWQSSLCWVASLDVIGDADGSWRNFEALRARGLDVIPTVHYGADPSALDRYAAEGVDFVGLGGMVGRKSEPQRLLRWCLSMMRHARTHHPEMRFHGWGVTHPELITALPWYSVDSSGFSACYRFGRLRLFDPSSGKNVQVDLDGKQIYKHGELLRRVYGVEPSSVAVSNRDTRRDLVRLSIAAVQKTEIYLRRRHGAISAPRYGITSSEDGGHIHAALGFPGAQATTSVSPTDRAPGPAIHAAITSPLTEVPFLRDDGPHIHAAQTWVGDHEYLSRRASS